MAIAMVRLTKEFKTCVNLFKERCEISIIGDKVNEWLVTVPCAKPLRERFCSSSLNVLISVPKEYPFSPPHVVFKPAIFHPNVDVKSGKMCIGMLAEWKSSSTISEVIESILYLMISPHLEDPVNIMAAKMWDDKVEFAKRSRSMQ